MPENRRAYNIQQFSNFRVAHVQEVGQKDNVAFPFGHRSIQDIFNLCFRAGLVIDGFYEECFKTNKEIPMVMIVRLKK